MPRLSRSVLFSGGALALLTLTVVPSLPRQALAVGEQSGRLRGRLVEPQTQLPIPGGQVELRGDRLLGQRSVVTDEEGRFDFVSVPPGRYRLQVRYEGLRTATHVVTVALGQSQDLEIPLIAELAATEKTTIIEERRRLDPDKLGTGVTLTAEQQAKLPTARTYQDIVRQAAGVVGGASPVMAGGNLRHNRYLVDGLDITDPATNTAGFDFNFDSIAQVEALVVPMDAQYNALGGVVNLITRTGSDRLTADASFYVNHQALSVGALSGTQLYEGRLLDQTDPSPPVSRYQANLNLGGPLLKQRAWFYLSMEYQNRVSSVIPGPPLNQQHPPAVFHGFFPRLKLSFAPTRRQLLTISAQSDPKFESNQRQTNSYAPEAEFDRQRTGAIGVINYQNFVTDHLIFELQTGLAWNRVKVSPIDGNTINSAHNDRGSGIIWNAGNGNRVQDDQRLRFQFDPTVKWIKSGWLGSHTFKAGAQLQALKEYWLYGTPGNLVYFDDTNQSADGGVLRRDPSSTERPLPCVPSQPNPLSGSSATPCFRIRTYDPTYVQRLAGWGIGGFIQDVWKPNRWLTLTPGIRVDYGIYRNTVGEVVQHFLGVGPRLGAALDLTRDGKTLVKVAYGRSTEVNTMLLSSYADRGPAEIDWSYNRATGRFDKFYSSAYGDNGYDLKGRCPDGIVRVECGNARLSLTPPSSDSVVASIERELLANVSGAITYTFRYLGNQWQRTELNALRTLDGGDFLRYGDRRYGSIPAYHPSADAFRRYNGIDFSLQGSPTQALNFYVAYTLSFLEGTYEDVIGSEQQGTRGTDPPRDFRLAGYLADDHRHQIKAQASYTWQGLSAGINLTYLSGAPTTRLYEKPIDYIGRYGWRGVDPGLDPNDIRKWTELRSPDFFNLDVRAQYDLDAALKKGHHLSVIVDVFNVLNLQTPIEPNANLAGFENRFGPTYGQVLNRQQPLRVQLAVRYQY